jgi:glycosyltransferase 2 family protein
MGRLIPLSAFVHLLSIVAILLAAHAVQVPLTLSVVLAIGPVLLLAQVLPISVGGWGVREAAAVMLLSMTGVDATSALLISITFGMLLFLATLPGVVFWLMLRE